MAVEKGEVVCRAHNISAHFGREPFDSWHKKGFDRHIVQTGRKRELRVPDVRKAREVLGYEATTTLDQMLDEVIPWVTQAVADGRL